MIAQERYKAILQMLSLKKAVETSELMDKFNVSLETVRRDLAYLENSGKLKRVHGGAVLEKVDNRESGIDERLAANWDKKIEIGEYVASLINEGDIICMDSSTTNHAVAKVLKNRFRKITVLTNYLPIINELAETDYNIVCPGGLLQRELLSFTGDIAMRNIEKYNVKKAFVSMSGISLEKGMTDFSFNEVAVKKKLMSISNEIYVVADSSKFGVVSLLDVCGFADISGIITDSAIDEYTLSVYRKNGINVICR